MCVEKKKSKREKALPFFIHLSLHHLLFGIKVTEKNYLGDEEKMEAVNAMSILRDVEVSILGQARVDRYENQKLTFTIPKVYLRYLKYSSRPNNFRARSSRGYDSNNFLQPGCRSRTLVAENTSPFAIDFGIIRTY